MRTISISPTRRTKVSLLVLSGIFMASLDMFIVNVAFPSIEADFGSHDLRALSWVLSAYSIVFAAALVPAGRYFDRRGRKRGFLLGVALFGVASALCAAAPTLGTLVGARVLQAIGAALLMPTSLGLLLPEYPPHLRATAVGIWSAVGGLAAAAAPPIGGLLVELSWRWVFLVNVPIVLVTVVAGWTMLREIRDPEPGARPDLAGAALLVAAIASLVWGTVGAPSRGWGDALTLGAFAASALSLAGFIGRSRVAAAPIVPAEVVLRPAFALAATATLLFSVAFSAMLLTAVLLLTELWGCSPLAAGVAIVPGPLTAACVASRGGLLVARFGARSVAVAGTLIFAISGLLAQQVIGPAPAYATRLLPVLVLCGIGSGLALPSLSSAAFSALPPSLLSTGIAVFSVSRQLGSALGVALLVAVVGRPMSASGLADAIDAGYLLQGGAALVAVVAASRLAAGLGSRAHERPVGAVMPGAPVDALARRTAPAQT